MIFLKKAFITALMFTLGYTGLYDQKIQKTVSQKNITKTESSKPKKNKLAQICENLLNNMNGEEIIKLTIANKPENKLIKNITISKKVKQVFKIYQAVLEEPNIANLLLIKGVSNIETDNAIEIANYIKNLGYKIKPWSITGILNGPLKKMTPYTIKPYLDFIFPDKLEVTANSRDSTIPNFDRIIPFLEKTQYKIEFQESNFKDTYFLNYLSSKDTIPTKTKLYSSILKDLSNKEHTNPRIAGYDTNWKSILKQLNYVDLSKIRITLDTLKNTEFINHTLKKIKEDLDCPYSEFGGVIKIKNNKLILNYIASSFLSLKDTNNNNKYRLPLVEEVKSLVGRFHFHATGDQDEYYAGPSGGFKGDSGDLTSAFYTDHRNFNIVFTKLEEAKFNVDIYFMNNCEPQVIDLGNYSNKNEISQKPKIKYSNSQKNNIAEAPVNTRDYIRQLKHK